MKLRHPLALCALFSLAGNSWAADMENGKKLVDDNCYSCHGNEVYTRSDRKVKSFQGLHKQVQRCELSLGLSWFDDQIENASGYLNTSYYHFKK